MNFKSSEQSGNSDQFCSDQKVKKKLGRIQDEWPRLNKSPKRKGKIKVQRKKGDKSPKRKGK